MRQTAGSHSRSARMRLGDRGAKDFRGGGASPAPARTDFARVGLVSPRGRFVGRFRPSPCRRPRTGRGEREAIVMTLATWTPERIAKLRGFVDSGLTCSQIAAEIGVTRNAVIGKIDRLGLSPGRPAAQPSRACPPRGRRPRLTVPAADHPPHLRRRAGHRRRYRCRIRRRSTAPSAALCSNSRQNTCRGRSAIRARRISAFAATMRTRSSPYCAAHARMAYRFPARRRA